MPTLPQSFINTIHGSYQEAGRKFLADLPELIEEASKRWGLREVQPVPNLSYNFVAFANQDANEVILKLGIPNPELTSEMHALKLFDGGGICQLLDCDEDKGFLLIERLKPGSMLVELMNDDERTHIAVDVMQKLWRTAPQNEGFIRLTDWFDGLKNIRPLFNGGTGPIPKELLEKVESMLPDLFADEEIYLIHGDFHHYNILSSERGWLAIDPKGVIGPAGYEIGPLMINPRLKPMDRTQFKVQAERRVSILHERFGWAREKIIGWALAHSVLSAYWDLDLEPESSIEAARIFAKIS
ncbi:MAG: phosphotransferase [Anaerolineales bacterium]|uniref:aminoglycoside phosphotransferase family protein n=1 Tax=Candidatus Villigracilis vicinus TaxID=3140679 RepID=UPI00313688D5|nr:phosphotransferase [Anaerolineales bacterium]